MFNGKYTDLKRVIENIERDYEYDNQLYKDDVREWAVRAMNLIGVSIAYDTVIEEVEVVNFRAEVPTDIVEFIGIRDANTKEMLSSSTDEFITSLDDYDAEESAVVAGTSPSETIIPAYKITNGYIFFNFKKGSVEVAYKKYKLSENGCLMIPDVDRYLMGIEAFIVFKIDSKLYRRGSISRDLKFESEQNWLWYVNSAANKMITPDYNVAENLSRRARTMRAASDSHSRGFGDLNFPTVKRF